MHKPHTVISDSCDYLAFRKTWVIQIVFRSIAYFGSLKKICSANDTS